MCKENNMTLTLEGAEVTEYFNMLERIKVMDKVDRVVEKRKTYGTFTSRMERDAKLAEDVSKPTTHRFSTRQSSDIGKTNWQQWELDTFTETQKGTPSRATLTWLSSQLPNRTEAGIRAKLWHEGYAVERNIVVVK